MKFYQLAAAAAIIAVKADDDDFDSMANFDVDSAIEELTAAQKNVVLDCYNIGWDEDAQACRAGYSAPTNYTRRQIFKNYKASDSYDNRASGIDALFQDAVKMCIYEAHCMQNEQLARMDLATFGPAMRSAGVDWNCHDDECDIPMTLKGIWGYGCWCNFGSDLMKGKGTPVNPHDKVCQDMQLCLRCAEMDGVAGNYGCNVKTQEYNSLLALGVNGLSDNENSINSGCSTLNGNDKCAAHVCTCEIQMINDLLALVWQGYTHDMNPRHPDNPFGGSFDWEAQCYIDPTGEIVKECCGKYPFRFPFNTVNKECCEKGGEYRTYNPLDQQCCASGVKKVGDAC